jgi:hypothetical protein
MHEIAKQWCMVLYNVQVLEEFCQKSGLGSPVYQLHSTMQRGGPVGQDDFQLFLFKVGHFVLVIVIIVISVIIEFIMILSMIVVIIVGAIIEIKIPSIIVIVIIIIVNFNIVISVSSLS